MTTTTTYHPIHLGYIIYHPPRHSRQLAYSRITHANNNSYCRNPTVADFGESAGCFGKPSRPNEAVTDLPSWATTS